MKVVSVQRGRLYIFLGCGLVLVTIGALFVTNKIGSPLGGQAAMSSVLLEELDRRNNEQQGTLVLAGERAVLHVEQFEDTVNSDTQEHVVFISFLLRELPGPGERRVLLSRNKSKNGRRTDASIAIEGTLAGIRPLVSNGNPARSGRWMVFSDHALTIGVWYTLIVSRLSADIVSVNLVGDEGTTSVFLGAQKILNSDPISSSYSISVGSIGAKSIYGEIGTFGVLQGATLFPEIERYFRASILQEYQPPQELADKVQLWASPFVDMSPHRWMIRREQGYENKSSAATPKEGAAKVGDIQAHAKEKRNAGGKRKGFRKNNRVRKKGGK
jgi:hypothetical protein